MKRSKRMAATLALAAGMTMVGGIGAQADTTGVATSAQSSTTSDLPISVGPFETIEECEEHRANNPKARGDCHHITFSWYYTADR